MAATNEQILTWLSGNPTATDAEVFNKMQSFGVTPTQLAQATGGNLASIQNRYNAQLQTATSMQPPVPVAPVPKTPAPVIPVTPVTLPTQPSGTSGTNLIADAINTYDTINSLTSIPSLFQSTAMGPMSVAGSTSATTLAAAADAAAGEVLLAGGTAKQAEAAANAVLGNPFINGLKNMLNPASLVLAGFGAFVGSREAKAEARREYDRQLYNAAKTDLINRGMNPEELYSPANIGDWLTDSTIFNDPTMTPEQVAQEKQDQVIREHANKLVTSQQTSVDVSQNPQRDMGSDMDIAADIQSGALNVVTSTDGQQYVIDKEGYVAPYTAPEQPEIATLTTPAQWDTTGLEPDTTLTEGDLSGLGEQPATDAGGFDYSVYGTNEQIDPNAKPREGSIIVWRHTNPDGSVVVGDPMGEIWYEKPPEIDTTVIIPTVDGTGTGAVTGTGATTGTTTTTGTGTTTGTTTTTGTVTTPTVDTGTDTTITTDTGTDTTITTGTGTDTTLITGTATEPGEGTDTEKGTRFVGGMLGGGPTETSQLVFPELFKFSESPYTLLGNLLTYT